MAFSIDSSYNPSANLTILKGKESHLFYLQFLVSQIQRYLRSFARFGGNLNPVV